MIIYISLDDDSYVDGWSSTQSTKSDIKLSISKEHGFFNTDFSCWQYKDGHLTFDKEKQQRLIEQQQELVNQPSQQEIDSMMKASVRAVRKLIRIDELTDDEIADIIDIYEEYKVGKLYYPGDIFKYENQLYEVIFEHTSQKEWKPDETPSTYKQISADNVIPEWEQPDGYADAYNKGDKVIYDDDVYTSLVDQNTWIPKDNPTLWEKAE